MQKCVFLPKYNELSPIYCRLDLWPDNLQKRELGTMYYRLIWPVCLASAITYASSGPAPPVPEGLWFFNIDIDKVAHFFVFGLLATSLCRYNPKTTVRLSLGLLAIVLTSLFGLSDELHQSLNPLRSFEMADWAADTFGAIVAVLVYQKWAFYRRLLEKNIFRFTRQSEPLDFSSEAP